MGPKKMNLKMRQYHKRHKVRSNSAKRSTNTNVPMAAFLSFLFFFPLFKPSENTFYTNKYCLCRASNTNKRKPWGAEGILAGSTSKHELKQCIFSAKTAMQNINY